MPAVNFGDRGFLEPAELIPLTLSIFEELFVSGFPTSDTRRIIFDEYIRYIESFRQQINSASMHWIDGSFVTNKLNPNDLDVVVVINDDGYSESQSVIDTSFRMAGAKVRFPRLDIYTVREYATDNSKRYITDFDLAYWYNWFTKSRPNRAGQQFRKGFVQISHAV